MSTPLKYRWSLENNHLVGLTADMWWRLLKQNRFQVDPAYWHRAIQITLLSLGNSVHRHRENRLFRKAIEQVQITEPPVFVLGYWRSGTTNLHTLLAQDTDQFTFPNTYQVVNPHTFLSTEAFMIRHAKRMKEKLRPMDNMRVGLLSPQEDEFALLMMTLQSMYVGLSFPRHGGAYQKYLTFRNASTTETAEWKAAFLWFAKKLTLKNPRTILFKSPGHTARIRLLLEMFPKARFVHIHRHPCQVYQSSCHSFDTFAWYTYLQRPNLRSQEDDLLANYKHFYDAYFADRDLIPKGQFHEVSFDQVARDPVGAARDIYENLSLPGFDRFEPRLREYAAASLAGYKKNRHPELPPEKRQKIYQAWQRNFDAWGYKIDS